MMTDKELLEDLYLKKEMSIQEIADHLKLSYSGARYRLKKYDIPLRTDKQAMNTNRNRNKRSENAKGKKNSQWRGGKRITSHGYVEIYMPTHPYASKSRGTVYEHRLVMEKKIGRYLKPEEDVHHIDENKQNNDPDNLHLFSSKAEHTAHHQKLKKNVCRNKTP